MLKHTLLACSAIVDLAMFKQCCQGFETTMREIYPLPSPLPPILPLLLAFPFLPLPLPALSSPPLLFPFVIEVGL